MASPRHSYVHVCEQAPHALLFPRAVCAAHHGGIGTTAEAMRAGKPQMIVPFFGDQPDHGARTERLGLGALVQLPHYSLRLLSGEVAQTAEHHAMLIAAEPGVEAVADWAVATLRSSPDGAGI